MKRILLIFKNDVKRRAKSPWAVLVMLLIPVFMTAIMGAIFTPGEKKLPKIKVLIVDHDKNIASKFVLGAFDSEQMKDMFQVTTVAEPEGKKLISKGKASALIIIPEKFSERLAKAEKSEFIVIKNPSEQFLPTIVEEFMTTFAVAVSGFSQVFAEELKMVDAMMNLSIEKVDITDLTPIMEKAQRKIVTLKKILSPLLIELKTEITDKKEKTPGINMFALVLPGISVMFLLFIIEIFLRDILTEREDGKLQRIMFAPIRPIEFITARIISGWLMGIFIYLVIIVLGILLFNISWGNYLHLFLFIAVSCFWIAAFFALTNSLLKNKNQAGAILTPIILVFSAFGGSMLPVSQLPRGLGMISNFTPNHWFIKGVLEINEGVFPVVPLLVLLVSGLILFILGITFLKKRITV